MHISIDRSVGRSEKGAENVSRDVAVLQNHLATLSELLARPQYNPGKIDALIGAVDDDSATIQAIEAFQRVNQLAVDGVVGREGETIREIHRQLELALGNANDGNPNPPGQEYFPFTAIPRSSWKTGGRAFGAVREGGKRAHAGCDLYLKHGTWVHAMADGRVVRGPYPFYAHTFAIEVEHGDYVARYGEIRPACIVREGDIVRAGQRIGMVGHLVGISVPCDMLHLEMYGGSATGPLSVDSAHSKRDAQGVPFNRRSDLLDPTNHLDKLKTSTPLDFLADMATPIGRPLHEEQLRRRVNTAGVALVKEFEGFYENSYRCPAGVWTIGYGHTRSVSRGQTITRAEAEALLQSDLASAGTDVQRLIDVPLSDNQFAALASFTFNVGPGALEASTLRKKLNRGQYDAVPIEMGRWVNATVNGVKTTLRGLVRRRAAEAELWLQPEGALDLDPRMPHRVEVA
ncbi:MAG: glycoside hydrolase family protein [Candidatus Hydrogenedentes bacterium]|nr:glycoside hydrolase family protein [Candidatus Hydrogenedentota bacterium]